MSQEAAERSFSFSAYIRLVKENRDFRLLWFAQIVSEIGDWFYSVAIYSLLLEFTGEAKSVGLAVVLQLLPQVFVAPIAGVINDRLSRRSVMIFADIARFFVVLAMIFAMTPDRVWLIWLTLICETVMWALFEPGRSAIIPNICRGKNETLVANALSSTTWAFNLAVGAGLGGFVAHHFGRTAVFLADAASFLISAALLSRIAFRETHHKDLPPFQAKDLVDYKPIFEGLTYVKRDMRMLATLLVKAGMGLLGAHWVILPVLGERIFPIDGHGTLSMSLLFGARGVGALVGSFASGSWAMNRESRMRAGIFWGFVVVALSYIILSRAPLLWIACLAVAAGHAGSSMAWVFSTTMLQRMTEDRFRGRVFSADFAGLFLMMSAVSYAASVWIDLGHSVRTVALLTGLAGLIPAVGWLAVQRLWRNG
jgi:MFS family permease